MTTQSNLHFYTVGKTRGDFAKFTAFNMSFLWHHLIPVRCKVRLFECDVKYLPPSAIRNWSHTPPDRMNRRSDLDKLKVKRNLIFFYFELQNAFLTLNEASDNNKTFFPSKFKNFIIQIVLLCFPYSSKMLWKQRRRADLRWNTRIYRSGCEDWVSGRPSTVKLSICEGFLYLNNLDPGNTNPTIKAFGRL